MEQLRDAIKRIDELIDDLECMDLDKFERIEGKLRAAKAIITARLREMEREARGRWE